MPTPPLNPHVRIVDEQGRPTPEFIRWAQSQRDVNENIPETAQGVSDVLDKIGATRGSLLYRAVANWNVLVPGLAGRFLRSNGVGADPSWQTAAFTDLSDVDTDYTGHAGEAVLVNATEDGLEYGAVSGGGGGISPYSAPPTVSALTTVNAQTKHVIADSSRGGLVFGIAAGSNVGVNTTLWGVSITDGDFDFKVHLDSTVSSSSTISNFVCVRDAAGGRFLDMCHRVGNTLRVRNWVSPTSFGGTVRDGGTVDQLPDFLRIQRTGSTVYFSWSRDSTVWVPFTSQAIGATLPATTFVGVGVDSNGTTIETQSWVRGWELT